MSGGQQPIPNPTLPAPVANLPPGDLKDADLRNIQGDIVLGLPKKKQRFFFFKITDVSKFRRNINDLIPLITTVSQTQLDRDAIAKRPRKSDILHMGGLNIAFTHAGLLAIDKTKFAPGDHQEPHFTGGMKSAISDIQDNENNWKPENWKIFDQGSNPANKGTKGFTDPVHGVVFIVGDDDDRITAQDAIVKRFLGDSVQFTFVLDGHDRPGLEAGNEHFGYKDGISHPFIIGTEKWRSEKPGQGAVKPGVILCGRDGDSIPRQAWQVDGSFMVFRYLRQKVPEFDKFCADTASKTKLSKDLIGARMVGRWKSGAPLDIAPFQDDRTLAKNEDENNNFFFEDDDATSGNPHSRCPFAAHIRKTNPRLDITADAHATQRIIRRGIPYGDEVDKTKETTTTKDRGLLFVCYQSVLKNGFDLMMRFWANNPDFPFNATAPKAGIDPILGQTHKGVRPESDRKATGLISANAADPTNLDGGLNLGKSTDEWVEARGGEYFFSPSIASIRKNIALSAVA